MAAAGGAGAGKPKWLIAGGMGMVGRNLVKYLIDNNLASDIRVADKKAKFMAFLSPDHKAAMDSEIVECIQADCADDEFIDKVFEEARSGGPFDYVVNCAAETDLTKKEEYLAKSADAAAKLARGAAAMGVKKFVQISSAFVYASSSKPSSEASKLGPWTTQAEYMLKAEDAVKGVAGLPWVILRPSIIYGPGDVIGLMPRAVIAAAYKRMEGEKMEFLWGADLKLNTVHVFDVARAIYYAARKVDAGATFNLSDKGDTDQGKVSALLGSLFGIETGFYSSITSNLAKLNMDGVVDDANKTHLGPWLALLKENGIKTTPLSPFLHKQLLGNNSLCVDGGAIEAAGFKYAVPELTFDGLRDPVAVAIAQGIFPPVLPGAAGPAAGGAGKA